MYLRSGGGRSKKESEFYALDDYNKRQKLSPPPPPKSAEDLELEKELQDTEDLKFLYEAREVAPALFAKPGDQFEWSGRRGDVDYVEYVGRNMNPSKTVEFRGETTGEYKSPKKGWLIFRNSGGMFPLNVTNGGIRDACGAWPLACHSHYNEEGQIDDDTMCIPPEKVGPLKKMRCWDEDEDDNRNKEPEEIVVSKRLLKEAKKAAPVLLAKPGDKFEWCSVDSSWAEPCVMKYVGRNTLRPTSKHNPEAGWLVFKNEYSSENNIDILNGGIRDEIGAWPYDKYSHYSYKTLKEATTMFELALWKANIDQADDTADREACRVEVPGPVKDTLFGFLEGKRKVGTLCVPPSKCGAFKVYKEPSYW